MLSKVWAKWVAKRKKQFCKQNGLSKAKWAKNELWVSVLPAKLLLVLLLPLPIYFLSHIGGFVKRGFSIVQRFYSSAAVIFGGLRIPGTLCYVAIQPCSLHSLIWACTLIIVCKKGIFGKPKGWKREQNGWRESKIKEKQKKKANFGQGLITISDSSQSQTSEINLVAYWPRYWKRIPMSCSVHQLQPNLSSFHRRRRSVQEWKSTGDIFVFSVRPAIFWPMALLSSNALSSILFLFPDSFPVAVYLSLFLIDSELAEMQLIKPLCMRNRITVLVLFVCLSVTTLHASPFVYSIHL